MKKERRILIILIIGLFSILIILYFVYKQDKLNIISGVSIFGSISSLAGITVAYIQIMWVKQISKKTNLEISNALDELYKSISISDISKTVKSIQHIQQLVRSDKLELALYKMQDINDILVQIKHIQIIEILYKKEEYKQNLINLSIDISNINSYVSKRRKRIDTNKLFDNLEKIATFFNEIENKLKYKRNG